MKRILFICLGNICRSPMAAALFLELARREGLSDAFEVDSCALSREEEGHTIYPPARTCLKNHGIPIPDHRARLLTPEDYETFDLLVVMEPRQIQRAARITGGDPQEKIKLLLDYTGEGRAVADPWYTDDFETAYRDIEAGCKALLEQLKG